MPADKGKSTSGLDPDDATPQSVRLAVSRMTANDYPKGDCMPCGATIRIGVFFDAFGRNKDEDEKSDNPSTYSNIARLWEAHRTMLDSKRPPNQFWFALYYSGLGTDINKSAENNDWINTSEAAAALVGKDLLGAGKSVLNSATRANQLDKFDAKKRATDAFKKSAEDFSYRPLLKAYNDFKKDIKDIPATMRRVANVLDPSPARLWERSKLGVVHVYKNAKNDIKKNPLKVAQAAVRQVFTSVVMENVAIVRDSQAMSFYFGTGVDTRLAAALDQFKAAVDAVRKGPPAVSKIRKVELSVFGADRGCVLARAFVNRIAEKYKHRDDEDLQIDGVPIEIKFLGLFDAVSSIMSEDAGEVIGLIPYLGTIKPDYKDFPLSVPASVKRCVHYAAAHEMRFYQRLDSLEKTRGEQYLYPGTSCDVVGGAPQGSLGLNAELMRMPFRDMLIEALKAGCAMLDFETIYERKPTLFRRITIAHPISYEGKQYRIKQLVEAYRKVVRNNAGVDFLPHAETFLRWIAVRYQDADFRHSVTDPVAEWRKDVEKADYDRRAAAAKLQWEMQGSGPMDSPKIQQLRQEKQAADAHWNDLFAHAPSNNYTTVWKRLDAEAKDMTSKWEKMRPGYEAEQQRRFTHSFDTQMHYTPLFLAPAFVNKDPLNADQIALVKAWQEGFSGKNPLPDSVMALFDMLVHDTLLTSWQDHILTRSLYFRTRDKDVFGTTDYDAEDKKRKEDDANAARIDKMAADQAAMQKARSAL
jgi:hypothetical protein